MDILVELNNIMDYIENHLNEQIKTEELSKIVGCSSYHLSRMFPFLTGVTLSEYIRRRRLTMAAFELQQENVRVIDVALKYGYDSPTAFNGAFKNLHGISPNKAKELGAILKSYPKMSFQISIKGEVQINYRIEEKESFKIIGTKERVTKVYGDEDFNRIAELWSELTDEVTGKLLEISNNKIDGLIGVSANNKDDMFDYYIATTTDLDNLPNSNMEKLEIPALTWAIFESVGAIPDGIVNTWQRIFTEWFPHSGYESENAPCLEVYFDGDMSSSNYKCEIWVPVIKKNI